MNTLEEIRLAFPDKKWAEIEGFSEYFVSDKADVYSTKQNRIINGTITEYGYCVFSLNDKALRIHRLVAKAFITNPLNKRCVNHLDGNKQNNNVSNLEWCTYSENQQHSFDNGLTVPLKGILNNRSKPIVRIDRFSKKILSRHASAGLAIEELDMKLRRNLIWTVCAGLQKTHAGFVWAFEEDIIDRD